jgi:hypothetical protein
MTRLPLALFFVSACAVSRAQPEAAAEALIQSVFDGTENDPKRAMGLLSCGVPEKVFNATRELVAMGSVAAPGIERHIRRFEAEGKSRSGWETLLLAYAEILGRQSLPRLRQMEARLKKRLPPPGLRSVYDAMAKAMDWSSYVTADSIYPVRLMVCGPDHRHTADLLVSGWLRKDAELLREAIAPALRDEELSRIQQPRRRDRAIGYLVPALLPDSPSVTVSFFTQDGQSCGVFDFRLAQASSRVGYVIENKNLTSLFPILNACLERRG